MMPEACRTCIYVGWGCPFPPDDLCGSARRKAIDEKMDTVYGLFDPGILRELEEHDGGSETG